MSSFSFRPENYGQACAELISTENLPSLGPGVPERADRPRLESLTLENLFRDAGLRDPQMGQCCVAGLWLWFDFLDESHQVSQRIKTPSGSYWHGIMHRREPDYGNAKYWFDKVGDHPIYDPLALAAAELLCRAEEFQVTDVLANDLSWDPFRFVDLCQRYAGSSSPAETELRQIARLEWLMLFDFCYRTALGG